MKHGTSTDRPLQQVADAWTDLFSKGAQVGLDLLATVGRMPTPSLQDVLRAMNPGTSGSCGCRIPAPCWAPRSIGDVTSYVCPGGTATLRLQITNCGATPRTVHLEAAGPASGATLNPSTLQLGPLERGVSIASLSVGATASCDETRETLIWIRGCHDYGLRWKVRIAERGVDCCSQVDIEDCPDLLHHWYDHFYCQRQCAHSDRET
jgi:hypothetical protein